MIYVMGEVSKSGKGNLVQRTQAFAVYIEAEDMYQKRKILSLYLSLLMIEQ